MAKVSSQAGAGKIKLNNQSLLMAKLMEIQESKGYLPKSALEKLALETGLPLSWIYGVATFYTQFKLRPVGRYIIQVCHGTACYVSKAREITKALSDELGIGEGETTADRLFTLESVSCLGCCGLAPVMVVAGRTYGCLTPDKARRVIQGVKENKSGSLDQVKRGKS